jgi:hypothetical protein
VKDFVYITDSAYTKPEFIEMETGILLAIEFQLAAPTPYRFLERFAEIESLTDV